MIAPIIQNNKNNNDPWIRSTAREQRTDKRSSNVLLIKKTVQTERKLNNAIEKKKEGSRLLIRINDRESAAA